MPGASRLVPREVLERSGVRASPADVLRLKLVLAGAGGVIGVAAGGAIPAGGLIAPGLAYAGFVAPSLFIERSAARALRDAVRATQLAVEWLDALVSAGRPAENALVAVAGRTTRARLLDEVLSRGAAAYALGGPIFRVTSTEARAAGLDALAVLADDLDRARGLGRGSRAVVRDARDRMRAESRSQSLSAASRVESSLMLVLVLCYLPALMAVVVIPLFIGLLDRMAG